MADKDFVVKNGLVVNSTLIVATAGKVGINSSTPDATLTIAGTANVTGNVFVTGNTVFSGVVNSSALNVSGLATTGNLNSSVVNSSSLNVTGLATTGNLNTGIVNSTAINSTNVVANTFGIHFGDVLATSINSTSVNSASVTTGLATINSTILSFGNSTANIFSTNGFLSVTGNGALGNVVVTTNTTTGNLVVTSTATIATANVTGNMRVVGDLIVNGSLTYTANSTGDIVPSSNSLNLGSPTGNRWHVYASDGSFTNGVTVSAANSSFNSGLFFVDAINSRVGVSNTTPGSKLTVAGVIESTTGGIKFPDGTTMTTGASATAGSNTQVQFNSSGAFGADPAFTFNSTGKTLFVNGSITTNSSIIVPSGGTVTTPTITFAGDTGTGLFRSGTDQVSVTMGGAARLTVNSTLTTMATNVSVTGTQISINGTIINSTSYAGTSNSTSFFGGLAATGFVSNSSLSGLVAGLAANSATFLGTQQVTDLVSNSSLSARVAGLTSNSTSFFGGLAATGFVSNSSLSGLVAGLTSNSTTNFGGLTATGFVSNSSISTRVAGLTANSATFLEGPPLKANSTQIVITSNIPVVANSSTGTAGQALLSNSTGVYWGNVASTGGATGSDTDSIFFINGQTVNSSYTTSATQNYLSAGPITINDPAVVTLTTGSRWAIV